MSVKPSGTISITDVVNEFGGSVPHSLSEYYRGGAFVPNVTVNNGVPVSGPISMSSFYGSTRLITVFYEIIGGGGGGGAGSDNGAPGQGTFGQNGGTSFIFRDGNILVASTPGGVGGENTGYFQNTPGENGESSQYGFGGLGGDRTLPGQNAPIQSYGAGGGGAGGDAKNNPYDNEGNAGKGGRASSRITGSFEVVPGTIITVIIGPGGVGGTVGSFFGGNGASGYCRLTYDSNVRVFTNSNSFAI